jgi:DNA-binding MarR family transcriptional regulator
MRVMALLYRNRQASFTRIRSDLGVTSGNLQSHGQRLIDAGYVEARKVLAPLFEVRWFITPRGARAFEEYVRKLRELASDLEARTGEVSGNQKRANGKPPADDRGP